MMTQTLLTNTKRNLDTNAIGKQCPLALVDRFAATMRLCFARLNPNREDIVALSQAYSAFGMVGVISVLTCKYSGILGR
jgi:hypothetical protein